MCKKIICEICGKEIKGDERVAVFYDGNSAKYTHVMDNKNKYDCDYLYMMEQLNPEYLNNKNEINFDED